MVEGNKMFVGTIKMLQESRNCGRAAKLVQCRSVSWSEEVFLSVKPCCWSENEMSAPSARSLWGGVLG